MQFGYLKVIALCNMLVTGSAYAQSLSRNNTSKIKQTRPNIIIIMVDDMGFSDLGCYGGEIKTPNIDALASSGMMMTNFYNDARCCPTRASLLTGQYQHKVGLTRNGESLTKNGVTIAEALQQNGYATAMVGKWHLSKAGPIADKKLHLRWLSREYNPDTTYAAPDTYPANRGFEKYYGIIWGVVNYFNPFSLVEGTRAVKNIPANYYTTHAFTDKAIEYVNEYKNGRKPFFMYLAYNAPHWPVQAPAETIKKYEKTYLGGWDSLRRVRYDRMVAMKLINDKEYPFVEAENDALKWKMLSPSQKMNFSKRMATHAAMIDEVDQGVGKLISQLKKNGQYQNTVFFFMSDNGASPEIVTTPGYDRPSALSDGTALQYGYPDYDKIGGPVSYTGIGSGWASASNTPFRYWKAESYNGGALTPMFMTGPGIIQGVNSSLAHVMDIMPTCLAISSASYPSVYKGHKITSIDGHSLVPVMQGKNSGRYKDLFFEHEGGRALISAGYKIVALRKGEWAMYNLKKDKTESENLIQSEPRKAAEMIAKWQKWAKEMGLEND
ncbi:arylsulfatase [Arcticibacter tournemirensis]|uniref:Arylsulfatase n=1 Tax=Arcticibacter tournemirensis TaxID=699437 RepID=A0A5M9HB16_9SPHI|nr:arylsulfatase [Arcticibacter tournemirensis]KAA8482438.1 arylsulfatase [Arcticibacter tournemirensis]TQM51676.1 arylsulfatase [Arcticibacter tournemirensis]